jgi:O-antigen/teichoic acid export membrane protein
LRFREIGAYSGLAYLNQVTSVLVNFLFIRTLSLTTLGDIAIAKVWMQVMDYSHMGLRFSLDRYVPVWERHRSIHLLWICIGVSSIVSAALICLALLFTDNKGLILVFCIWGYGVAIATILKNYYRASADAARMLTTYFACPTIPAVAQTAAFFLWGFNGFLMVTVASSLVTTAYLLIKAWPMMAEIRHRLTETLHAVRAATATLFINALVIFLTFSVDRIILNAYSSKEVLGEYSIILFAFSLLLIIPSTVAEFIFPKIVRTTVEDGKIFHPREMLTILIPTAIATLVAYAAAPYLVAKLTSYEHLVADIQLVTLGVLPYAATPILFHVMSALDMRIPLVLSACVVLGLYVLALLWGGMHADNKLEFFTLARVYYGYLLLLAYGMCLMLHRRRTA